MGLFGKIFGKEEKKESCCCEMEIVELPEGDIAAPCDCGDACDAPGAESITLTVLGPGCKRCHQLHENAQAAASKADGSVGVEYVTDPAAIAEAGVMSTPALFVNGKSSRRERCSKLMRSKSCFVALQSK